MPRNPIKKNWFLTLFQDYNQIYQGIEENKIVFMISWFTNLYNKTIRIF